MNREKAADPTVSVVIIFLNAAPFLAEAIGSVRAQSFGGWELVLVDDGSSDGSSEIAREASGGDPDRIRLLEHPGHANLGTSASRELGLRRARGPLLLYLDADDILFVDALATLVRTLEDNPASDAALAATLFWNWHQAFSGRRDSKQDLRRWVGPHRPPRLLTEMTRDEYLHPANCSSLFRRQALLDIGGFEAEFTGMYEDTVLLAKLLLERPVVVIDDCVSAYRLHPASQCHRAAAEGTYDARRPNRDRTRYLRWLKRHVAARAVRDAGLRLAIERELFRFERPTLARALVVPWRAARRGARIGRSLVRRLRGDRVPADAPGDGEALIQATDALARALSAAGAPDEAASLMTRLASRRAA